MSKEGMYSSSLAAEPGDLWAAWAGGRLLAMVGLLQVRGHPLEAGKHPSGTEYSGQRQTKGFLGSDKTEETEKIVFDLN